jgi:hypothetical protein
VAAGDSWAKRRAYTGKTPCCGEPASGRHSASRAALRKWIFDRHLSVSYVGTVSARVEWLYVCS